MKKHLFLHLSIVGLMGVSTIAYGGWTKYGSEFKSGDPIPHGDCLEMICPNGCVENDTKEYEGYCCPSSGAFGQSCSSNGVSLDICCVSGSCVRGKCGCEKDEDCEAEQVCLSDKTCGCPMKLPKWDVAQQKCVQCLEDGDCESGYCDKTKHICACPQSVDQYTQLDGTVACCAPETPKWNLEQQKCVQCLVKEDCSKGMGCNKTTGLCENCPKGSAQDGWGNETPVQGCFCRHTGEFWWDFNTELEVNYYKKAWKAEGSCRICSDGNVVDYRPYIHEGCVDNSDCHSNQFCHILKTDIVNVIEKIEPDGKKYHGVDTCFSRKLKGICENSDAGKSVLIDNTREVLVSDNYMNWWSADNWCKAHKKKLIDALSLKYDAERTDRAVPRVFEYKFDAGTYWTSSIVVHGSAAKAFSLYYSGTVYWESYVLASNGNGYAGRAVCE